MSLTLISNHASNSISSASAALAQDQAKSTGGQKRVLVGVDQALREKGLHEKQMPGDGDCLFHSVLDQLKQHGIEYFVDRTHVDEPLRRVPATAGGLRTLAASYLPYLPEIGLTKSGHEVYAMMREAVRPGSYDKETHDLLPYSLAQVLGINLAVVQDGATIPLNEDPGVRNRPEMHIVKRLEHFNSTVESGSEESLCRATPPPSYSSLFAASRAAIWRPKMPSSAPPSAPIRQMAPAIKSADTRKLASHEKSASPKKSGVAQVKRFFLRLFKKS